MPGCFSGPPKVVTAFVKSVKAMWTISHLLSLLGVAITVCGLAILSAVSSFHEKPCPQALEKCFPGNSPGLGEYGELAAQYGTYLGAPLIGAGLIIILLGLTGAYATGKSKNGLITCATVLYSLLFLVIAAVGAGNAYLGWWVGVTLCEEKLDYQIDRPLSNAEMQTNKKCSALIGAVFDIVCEASGADFTKESFYCDDGCEACDCASTIETFCGTTFKAMVGGGGIALLAGICMFIAAVFGCCVCCSPTAKTTVRSVNNPARAPVDVKA